MSFYEVTLPSGISECPNCGLIIAYAPQTLKSRTDSGVFDINCPNPDCHVHLRLMRRLDEKASGQWLQVSPMVEIMEQEQHQIEARRIY